MVRIWSLAGRREGFERVRNQCVENHARDPNLKSTIVCVENSSPGNGTIVVPEVSDSVLLEESSDSLEGIIGVWLVTWTV